MLEACQRKHMFLGLGILVATTIFVLVLESRFTTTRSSRTGESPQVIENNSTCWMSEKYTIIEECRHCSDFDIVSQSLAVCKHTKFKEVLRCSSGEIVTRSCDRSALIDQQNFIKFEILCFIVGALAYFVSYARDRMLSRRTHQKLERQLNRVT